MRARTTIQIPGSKSYTNRALVMAALSGERVELENPLFSDDTHAMIDCLKTLGVDVQLFDNKIVVSNGLRTAENRSYRLFARDSGTTARFLLPLLCLVPGVKTIEGSERLNQRPISDLIEALQALGAEISYCQEKGKLPVTIASSTLCKNQLRLKSDASSQFCSALLLASPYVPGGLTLHLEGEQVSKPYIEMTLSAMEEWGIRIEKSRSSFHTPPGQRYQKQFYAIEGDYSSAGYFFAIAALTKSEIGVENLKPHSAQADRLFLEILERMGNIVTRTDRRIEIEGRGVAPLNIDMNDCPDQIMTIAVLAAFAKGTTRISGARTLREKESDRIAALQTELGKMGILVEASFDSLTIHGGSPRPAQINTYSDHRIAMSFAVAKKALAEIEILHPEVVNKTFPTFWDQWRSLP